MQQHTMTLAILAAALLLATPSSAALISAEQAIGESSEPHTIQLRGRNSKSSSSALSLSAITAGSNRFAGGRRPLPSSNRFDANRRPTRDTVFLPVSPGIAEGVDPENLPCLVETICEQPELSILCGFTTANLVEWSNNKNENFFVGEGEGIFFAPLDLAFQDSSGFSLMTNILSTDLADAAILENVLSYHAVPIDINATLSNNSTTDDLLFVVEDFECGEEVMMANGQTTRTICFQNDKVLMGSGNRNMRTLPRIIEEGIEACDGTVVLHYVNELILPGLPLVAMETQAPEVPRGETGTCPIESPEPNQSCQDPGERCSYGYTYTGCSWDDLKCIPTMTCSCFERAWMCTARLLAPCPEEDPELVVVIASTSAAEVEATSIPTKPAVPVTSSVLPTGNCDPNLPLPEQPSTPECPVDQPRFDESCSGYPEGETCNYNFMYTGCTWDTLQCSWIASCSCDERSETWACQMKSLARCGVFDAEVGEWVDNTPEGLPWGESCDPDEEPPTPPPIEQECPEDRPDFINDSCSGYSEGQTCTYGHMYMGCTWDTLRCGSTAWCSCDEASETWACAIADIAGCDTSIVFDAGAGEWVENTPKDLPWGDSCDPDEELPTPPEPECPEEMPDFLDDSCSEYTEGKTCNYNHMYIGCTWDTLRCFSTDSCSCIDESETWACRMARVAGCDASAPEGLPWGESCDPDEELPPPPPTITREEGSVEGRLSDECPPSADFGSCSGYEPDLPCDYNYSYTGCTWETLECRPIRQCQCDKFGNGNWACRLESRQGCFDKPEGHPGGLVCDPNDPLPIPLLPTTPVVATSRNEERDQKVAVAEMIAGGAMP